MSAYPSAQIDLRASLKVGCGSSPAACPAEERTAGVGASSSLPCVPAKVPSPPDPAVCCGNPERLLSPIHRPSRDSQLAGCGRPHAALRDGVGKWQGWGRIADLRAPLPHPIWSNRCLRARQRGAIGLQHPIAEPASGYSVIAFLSECITHPGHAPRIMRPFGWHHYRVYNAELRGGERIKPGNLSFVIVAAGPVSVGPSSEALCNAFCQRNIHWSGLSV